MIFRNFKSLGIEVVSNCDELVFFVVIVGCCEKIVVFIVIFSIIFKNEALYFPNYLLFFVKFRCRKTTSNVVKKNLCHLFCGF